MAKSLFEWDDAFLIGIKELDYEHRGLLAELNEFHQELERHDDRATIERTLGEVYSRLAAHFALEERVMRERKYAYFVEHKDQHEKLLDTFVEFMVRYRNDPNLDYSDAIENDLKTWIVDHIRSSDRKMSLMIS